MDKLLKAREVTALTGIPKTTIYHLATTDELPHLHFGSRAVRFPQAALENWIAERTSAVGHGSAWQS